MIDAINLNTIGTILTFFFMSLAAIIVFVQQTDRIIDTLRGVNNAAERLDVPLSDIVHYLDKEPDVQLSDRAITKLKQYAARNPSPIVAPENQTAYEAGLKDGVTELSKFILEELKEQDA